MPADLLFRWRAALQSDYGPASSTTRHVLVQLSLRMDMNGDNCYPSIKTVSGWTRLSGKTVGDHLTEAASTGWLRRERRGLRGQGWVWQYWPAIPEEVEAPGQRDEAGSHPSVQRSEPLTHPHTQRSEPGSSKDVKQLHTTTTETTTNIYTGDFEDFWHLYPKRQGGDPKKAAFRRWTRLVKNGVPVGEIIEGVKRYAALCSEQGTTGTKFVMQARTFLGPDERWKDSYEVEGSAGGDINLQELSW